MAFVDMGRGEVLEVGDLGVVPVPPKSWTCYPDERAPAHRPQAAGDRPSRGPELEVEGNLVRWRNWSLRIGMDPLEGLVL